MPKLSVYDMTGKKTGEEIELMDYVFGVEMNEAVVHQAVVMQQANERQGTHDENNEAHMGDTVKIVQTRPLSKDKCWRVVEILEHDGTN